MGSPQYRRISARNSNRKWHPKDTLFEAPTITFNFLTTHTFHCAGDPHALQLVDGKPLCYAFGRAGRTYQVLEGSTAHGGTVHHLFQQKRIQDFGQEGPNPVLTPGGLNPFLLIIGVFPFKLPEHCMILKKILEASGVLGPNKNFASDHDPFSVV